MLLRLDCRGIMKSAMCEKQCVLFYVAKATTWRSLTGMDNAVQFEILPKHIDTTNIYNYCRSLELLWTRAAFQPAEWLG
jgi:hypothetical protein